MSKDITFDESAKGTHGRGDTSQARNKDQGANQKIEFASQTPDKVVISDEEQGGSEKIGQDETQEQPIGSSSSGANVRKDDWFESIARRRSNRVIRQLDRYVGCDNSGDLDSIVFALVTGEDTDSEEP